jgi:transcriptional regulator with XRE-family HTH domain
MDTATSLGKKIKKHRQMKGLTQEELAEQMTVSVGFIGKCERGAVLPSLSNCNHLALIFGINLKELFNFDVPVPSRHLNESERAFNKLRATLAHDDPSLVYALIGVVRSLHSMKGRQPRKKVG